MKSYLTKGFRKCMGKLTADVQDRAMAAYLLWRDNPRHSSLRFKQVHATRPIFSVRVDRSHRVLGVRKGKDMIWFWIGRHDEYMKAISRY